MTRDRKPCEMPRLSAIAVCVSPFATRSQMLSQPPAASMSAWSWASIGFPGMAVPLGNPARTVGQTVGLRLVFARASLCYACSLVVRAGQADTRWCEGDRAGLAPARYHNPRVVG